MQQPISVEGLKSWLELQDGATEYDYEDITDCLLCQYFRSVGLPIRAMGSLRWTDTDRDIHKIPVGLNSVVSDMPCTNAAALERCNAVLAEQKSLKPASFLEGNEK